MVGCADARELNAAKGFCAVAAIAGIPEYNGQDLAWFEKNDLGQAR